MATRSKRSMGSRKTTKKTAKKTAPTKSSSSSKSVDYTLHKGESVAQYNARIASARGESAPVSTPTPTKDVGTLAKQLADVSSQAKSLGIDTQTADKMVAQTNAQGSVAFKGSSFDTPNTPVVPPVTPPVEPTPTDPTQTDPTQPTQPQDQVPQTPDGIITDPVTGNQYQQDASGAYVPYTGAQTASVGTTSPTTPSTYSGTSIVDFLNSSGQASDFNSRASLAQKYGITNYTGTASQNTQLLNTLRGASTTSPAQTYAPATVGSSDLTPAPATGEPTALDNAMSQFGVGFDPASFAMSPQISIQTLIKDLMKATNLPDITSNIDNISSEIEDLANERDDKIRAINDDPWLTEGVRVERVRKEGAKYEDRIKNKTAYLTLMQGAYDDARQQAQWVAQTALEQYDTQRRFQFDQLKYWTDQAEAQLKANNDAMLNDRDYELQLAKLGLDKLKATSGGGSTSGDGTGGGSTTVPPKKLTAAQQDEINNGNVLSTLAQKALSLGDSLGWTGVGGLGQGTISQFLAKNFGAGSAEEQNLRNMIGNITGTLAKLRGGTSFTPNEQKLLETYSPTINDSPLVLQSKLHSLIDFVQQKNSSISGAQTDTTTQNNPGLDAYLRSLGL